MYQYKKILKESDFQTGSNQNNIYSNPQTTLNDGVKDNWEEYRMYYKYASGNLVRDLDGKAKYYPNPEDTAYSIGERFNIDYEKHGIATSLLSEKAKSKSFIIIPDADFSYSVSELEKRYESQAEKQEIPKVLLSIRRFLFEEASYVDPITYEKVHGLVKDSLYGIWFMYRYKDLIQQYSEHGNIDGRFRTTYFGIPPRVSEDDKIYSLEDWVKLSPSERIDYFNKNLDKRITMIDFQPVRLVFEERVKKAVEDGKISPTHHLTGDFIRHYSGKKYPYKVYSIDRRIQLDSLDFEIWNTRKPGRKMEYDLKRYYDDRKQ